MNRYEKKRARLCALQTDLRRKLYEYNIIATLNSNTEAIGEVLMSKIEDEFGQQEVYDNLLPKIDSMRTDLNSSNSSNFLLPSWPQSIDSVKEKIQTRSTSSIDDIKMYLAALIFNSNINIPSEDENKRLELLNIFDLVMQM